MGTTNKATKVSSLRTFIPHPCAGGKRRERGRAGGREGGRGMGEIEEVTPTFLEHALMWAWQLPCLDPDPLRCGRQTRPVARMSCQQSRMIS